MKKIHVMCLIMYSMFIIGCAKSKDTSVVTNEVGKVESLYDEVISDLDNANEFAKSLYENINEDSDDFRKCQKNMREYQNSLNDIDLEVIKESYQSDDKYEEVTKEFGFSLIDKQEQFDSEYGVEDIR